MLQLSRAKETQSIRIAGTLGANDGQVLRAAALAGLGILIEPLYIIYDDIIAGRLVPTLTEWEFLPHYCDVDLRVLFSMVETQGPASLQALELFGCGGRI